MVWFRWCLFQPGVTGWMTMRRVVWRLRWSMVWRTRTPSYTRTIWSSLAQWTDRQKYGWSQKENAFTWVFIGRHEKSFFLRFELLLFQTLKGHSSTVTALATDPKGRTLFTAGADACEWWNFDWTAKDHCITFIPVFSKGFPSPLFYFLFYQINFLQFS